MISKAFALAWLGLAALAGPAAAACKLDRVAELPVTMEGNAAIVSVKINGQDARLIADSGAFFSMLTPESAARFKLKVGGLPPRLRVVGVNGDADVGLANVRDFGVVGGTLHDWEFLVGGSRLGGGADGLLGQNFLTVVDSEFDLANGVIRLFKTTGCGDQPLVYWAKDQPYSALEMDETRRNRNEIIASASINGQRIKVVFDSGAYRSILSLRAAKFAGVDPSSPGVQAAGASGGIGRKLRDTWIGPFASFKIGDEEIKNTRLRIGSMDLEDADMLLGGDFFLSHHIFFSRAQEKIYFTYNGGPVFRLDRLPASAPAAVQDHAGANLAPQTSGQAPSAAATDSDAPKDAAGFARRSAARAARGEIDAAIADLDQAIILAPDSAELLFQRSQLQLRQRRAALALADLQAALKINPRYAPALLSRGSRDLSLKDEASARADFEAAVAADPDDAMRVAEIYVGQGWFDRSIELMDQWIAAHARDDRLPDALNGRCRARALWGRDLDKALADCDRAVQMSRVASFLDSRGLVHLRLGQYSQAIADYDGALKDNPRQAWSLYGRGLAELKTGDKDKGDADIKAAVAINPRLPEIAGKNGIAP